MAGPNDPWYTIAAYTPRYLAPQFMVSGGLENGRQLFVCRAVYGTRVWPGKTWDGPGGCLVAIQGEPLVTSYQVLATPPIVSGYFVYRWATRTEMITNPGLRYLAVQGGFDGGTPRMTLITLYVAETCGSTVPTSVSIRDDNSEGHLMITAQ